MSSLKSLIEEVLDNLKTEGVSDIPQRNTVLRAMNRSKDVIVRELELIRPTIFLKRKDYSVSSGDASVTLPDGSTTGEPAIRRIVSVDWVYNGREYRVDVKDRNSTAKTDFTGANFWMYPEGDKLYFQSSSGELAEQSLTLRLRYAAVVPDLDLSDGDSEYDDIPNEWMDLLIIRTMLRLLPAKSSGYEKWSALQTKAEQQLLLSGKQFVKTGPLRITMDEDS